MKLQEAEQWVSKAQPNERVTYMTGLFAGENEQIRDYFWVQAMLGKVALFQRKISIGVYEYVAIRCRPEIGEILRPRRDPYYE